MTTLLYKPLPAKAQPKILASGAGESQLLLTHTITWKTTASDTSGLYAMFEMVDHAGGGAPLHSHPWEETFYILAGEIEILIEDRREVCGAGAVVHIPADVVHAFQVVSPVARALVLMAPGDVEGFYREASDKLTTLPPDPLVMKEIADKYNLQLL